VQQYGCLPQAQPQPQPQAQPHSWVQPPPQLPVLVLPPGAQANAAAASGSPEVRRLGVSAGGPAWETLSPGASTPQTQQQHQQQQDMQASAYLRQQNRQE
jgi:hypothetical protein